MYGQRTVQLGLALAVGELLRYQAVTPSSVRSRLLERNPEAGTCTGYGCPGQPYYGR